MWKFLKSASGPAGSPPPPKRARLEESESGGLAAARTPDKLPRPAAPEVPPVAQQHAFLDVAKRRDWPAVRSLLASSPGLVNVQPAGRWTALHQAAEAGDAEVVRELLALGADAALRTRDGRTPHDVASDDAVRGLLVAPCPVAGEPTAPSSAPAPEAGEHKSEHEADASKGDVSTDLGVGSEPGAGAGAEDASTGLATSGSGKPNSDDDAVWQVQSRALAGAWVGMDMERQALIRDAMAAGVLKALIRDCGRSYLLDLVDCTQTDLQTGNVCKIRSCSPPEVQDPAAVEPQGARGTESRLPVGRSVREPPGDERGVEAASASGSAECSKSEGDPLAVGETMSVPGSGSATYTIKNCGGGVWSCTCVAWKMQGKRPTKQRSCKHLRELRGASAEQLRCGTDSADTGAGSVKVAMAASASGAPPSASGAPPSGAKPAPGLLLANKWEEKVDPVGWWISEKLDGMRAFWDPAARTLLSRLGNAIPCPEALLAGLPDVALDGELFLGRGRFQELMSVVKNGDNRGKADGPWRDVAYTVFDLPEHAGPFEERMEALRARLASGPPPGARPFARAHDQEACRSRSHLDERLKAVQALGGEGLMLRRPRSLYERGRSSSLLKVKTFQDEEAVVIGHEAGKGRNASVVGALKCRNRGGAVFSVGTGLSDAQRADPPKVGEIITYRFFELTKDNKPRFPSFVGVRADADRTGLEL